jgi:GTP cyclohydrolase FolE2
MRGIIKGVYCSNNPPRSIKPYSQPTVGVRLRYAFCQSQQHVQKGRAKTILLSETACFDFSSSKIYSTVNQWSYMAIFRLVKRDIRKVTKIQHQNPEFDHKGGEIEKYISIQGG